MSRIGKLPIQIPSGVTVTVSDDHVVTVKGPKGTLAQSVNNQMGLEIKDGIMHVTRPNDLKQFRAMHGLYRALIHNMVVGVTTGFTKNLELVGVGYRAQADNPSQLTINLAAKTAAQRAGARGVTAVVFDRGGYIYTGRVAQLAAGAREGGLDF